MSEESENEGGKGEGGISRRTFVKGVVVGAAVAGVLAATPSVLAGSGGLSENSETDLKGAVGSGPIVVYVRDQATGEVEIMSGTKAVVRRDPSLVSRLKDSRIR